MALETNLLHDFETEFIVSPHNIPVNECENRQDSVNDGLRSKSSHVSDEQQRLVERLWIFRNTDKSNKHVNLERYSRHRSLKYQRHNELAFKRDWHVISITNLDGSHHALQGRNE